MEISQGTRGDSSLFTISDLNLNSQCSHVQIRIKMTWGRAGEISIRAFFSSCGLLEFWGKAPKKELSGLQNFLDIIDTLIPKVPWEPG